MRSTLASAQATPLPEIRHPPSKVPSSRPRTRSGGGDVIMGIHPTPPGTRDILPEEMRELRALEAALRAAFDEHGYGEVATPTIEYAEVPRRGDERYANAAYPSSTSGAACSRCART